MGATESTNSGKALYLFRLLVHTAIAFHESMLQ